MNVTNDRQSAASSTRGRKSRKAKAKAEDAGPPRGAVLKYPGSKLQSVPIILPVIPKRIATYHEAFVGGGSVFFALAAEVERRYAHAVLSDINPHVMNVYAAVRDDVEGLMHALDLYAEHRDKKSYYRVRSGPEPTNLTLRAARRIYLNKCCFRGIHRENASGGFNVPFGHYPNPTLYDREKILAASAALRGVELAVCDFAAAIARAADGDFVYADPPYIPRSATANFDDYSAGGFALADHVRLRGALAQAMDRGVACLLSGSDTAATRSIYACDDARRTVFQVGVLHAVNPHEKGEGSRAVTPELLIAYYDPPPPPETSSTDAENGADAK